MTIYDAHLELVRANLGTELTEEDTLLWMVLVHTHRIVLSAPILSDRPGVAELAAVTERDAAEIAGALWYGRGRPGTAGADWWARYQAEGAYQTLDDVPPNRMARLAALREQLLADPRVVAVGPED